MKSDASYYEYLNTRSFIGYLYRKYLLYPRINRHLIGRILDVGCGIGDMLFFSQNIIGADVNTKCVESCVQRGLSAVLIEDDRLPFISNEFSSVLMDNVLEHIESPNTLLSDIYRVLAPRGVFVVGVPGERGYLNDLDHKIFYSEVDLIKKIEGFGFQFIKSFGAPLIKSKFLSAHMKRYCLYAVFIKD